MAALKRLGEELSAEEQVQAAANLNANIGISSFNRFAIALDFHAAFSRIQCVGVASLFRCRHRFSRRKVHHGALPRVQRSDRALPSPLTFPFAVPQAAAAAQVRDASKP